MGIFSWLTTGNWNSTEEAEEVIDVFIPEVPVETVEVIPEVKKISSEIEAVIKDIKDNPEEWREYIPNTYDSITTYAHFYKESGLSLQIGSLRYPYDRKLSFSWKNPPYKKGAPIISDEENTLLNNSYSSWKEYHETKKEKEHTAKYGNFQKEVLDLLKTPQLTLDL